jgi:GAF domain-containing protein
MITRIIDLFRSEDDKDPSFIRLVRNILIFVLVTNLGILPLVTGIAGEETQNIVALITISILIILNGISLVFAFQGSILPAKLVIPFGLMVAIAVISNAVNGLKSSSFFAMPVVLVISATLLGRRSLFVTTPVAILIAVALAFDDISGVRSTQAVALDDAFIIPILLSATAGITHLLISRLNESTLRAQQSEEAQKLENAELITLRASLEERVQRRTIELENANQVSEKRARQFQAVTKVMNVVSSIQSLDELLPLITQVISEQFNVYHTGVFLLDEKKEFAILRASNSEGGQRMLARKHTLLVGQTGIVGFVTATGQARIALDVGADSVYFDNPDLPDTRSEIALPLRYAGQIIGALDVQSTEPNAFLSDDVEVLTTLADQVSVAINNAFTLAEAQKALLEAQSAIGQVAREAWEVLRPTQLGLGFSYSDVGVKPLQKPIENQQINQALSKGKTILTEEDDQRSRLAIPIRLRGQVIGVMQLSARKEIKLTEDDAEIAEAVAERLSLAIETATLLQSTQHRADIEKLTASITSKVSSSSRFDTILQTAAQELSRALGGSDVIVQIEPAAMKMYT